MESRKYSTGTKGRIKMHSDQCKEFIRANSPTFGLANEFVESIDPGHDERVWQRFQTPADILPELGAWLGGGIENPAPSSLGKDRPAIAHRPGLKPASQLPRSTEKIDGAFQRTRAWLASADAQDQLKELPPLDAAETALRRLYEEFTGC